MQLTLFDLGVIALMLVFGVRGWFRGFIAEMAGLLGLVAGLVLARTFFQEATQFLLNYIAPNAAPAVALITLFLAGMLLVALVARVVQNVLQFTFASWLDSLLGFVAGLGKGAIACALVGYVLMFVIPHFAEIKDSQTMPWLMEGVRQFIQLMHITIPMP